MTDESPTGDASPAIPPKSDAPKGERIAKRLARAGLCSRRDAERWINDGRVSLNGEILTSPAVTVDEGSRILVDGKPLPEAERTRLWRYHKPSGLVTSHKDPEGRPTVFERLPEDMPRVISVGRLDLNSEGLLLLTNDGELARRMELPSTGWIRRYRVRVHGTPDLATLATLEKGVVVDGLAYGPIKALIDRQQGSNAWLTVSLKEGKNREIRKVMEYLGWSVSRLIRIAYGPFQLGLLEEGAADEVPARVLREQLGTKGEEPTGTARVRAKEHAGPHFKEGSRFKEGPRGKDAPRAKESSRSKEGPRPKDDARPSATRPQDRKKPHADRRRPS